MSGAARLPRPAMRSLLRRGRRGGTGVGPRRPDGRKGRWQPVPHGYARGCGSRHASGTAALPVVTAALLRQCERDGDVHAAAVRNVAVLEGVVVVPAADG